MLRCQKCNSDRIYSVEFRNDYAKPREFYPVNGHLPIIKSENIPYYMDGYYCMDCGLFCSVYDDKQSNSL